jgi:cysteine desulfurase
LSAPVYLDYAASTPVAPEVAAAMQAVLADPTLAGNPSALTHEHGRRAATVIEAARADVAALINADPDEIVFTSGATESDNLAIVGAARFRASRGRHLVTSRIEHPAVLETCRALANSGWRLTELPPDCEGRLDPATVAAAIGPDTVLVSVAHANHELGTAQDLAALGAVGRARDVWLHVDAAQSAGRLPIDVRAHGIDLLSLSAHKLYGPTGIGALFIDRTRVRRIEPLFHGGGQERGLRPGTLPTAAIVGFGTACRLARVRHEARQRHAHALLARLWQALEPLGGIRRNGPPELHAGHILNVEIARVHGESLLAGLVPAVSASGGSACTSLREEPSDVLRALGRDAVAAQSALRLSVGEGLTTADIDRAATAIVAVVSRLRAEAPDAPDPFTPTARGCAGSREAGTWVSCAVQIQAGRITALRFGVYGCPATQAACRYLQTELEAAPVAALAATQEPTAPRRWLAALDLPESRLGRLLTVQDALRNCLADWDNAHRSPDSQGAAGGGHPDR